MIQITFDAASSALFEPVGAMLDAALAALPDGPALRVVRGDAVGFARLDGDTLILSEGLFGAALQHPDEADSPMPPLDRWRRALAAVLEGGVLRALAARAETPPVEDWRWRGIAIHLADRALPDAGLALPDLATALQTGEPGAWPRAGAAVYRVVEAAGDDPWATALNWIAGDGPDPERWLALGARALGASGVAAWLPIPTPRVAASDIPLALAPWSWRPLAVPAHARGGLVATTGDARVLDPWARGGEALHTIASASGVGGTLRPEVGFPTGEWEVASARAFGQMFGARGLVFHCQPSGALRIVMADAFVGPVAALEVAEKVGTSGIVTGRWRVDGPRRIRFSRIVNEGLTLHGRQSDAFRIPTPRGEGMGEWLGALEDGPWRWDTHGDRLVLRGPMMGGEVEMWWRPSA